MTEYLEGQFDQRADSASQCVQFLTGGVRPLIKCANVYYLGDVTDEEFTKIKNYLINPVDSKEGSMELPTSLESRKEVPSKMRIELDGFIDLDETALKKYFDENGFAMTFEDLKFVQDYFRSEKRNPTLTEIKVIDTYWSDHCRHTTFSTELKSIKVISNNDNIQKALDNYKELFAKYYGGREDKYYSLMNVATIAVKALRAEGYLDNLDESDEINACSVVVNVDVDGKDEEWLIMFKNETHNHPTEIEPFGGAATCLGGAIRDPLSGRTYVYQAMRVTGAGNPLEEYKDTLKGKLPQRVLTKTALAGFSSYGNQIGLATGKVHEIYNDRYKAKRLETGYVIGGNRRENVKRDTPKAGDIVVMVGGDTGRDGCGGATGSSKSHTLKSVEICGAEVQKGNALEERKLQRLFRNPKASQMIIRCNDFGAGGVCVAIGELSDGLQIYLDRVNKKYEGLTATELAISESQERMAVVVKASDAAEFISLAKEENLKAVKVAEITDTNRLSMTYGNESIVDISRDFLNTNGVKQQIDVVIKDNYDNFFEKIEAQTELLATKNFVKAIENELKKLNVCSQKGAGEVFDSTIGASTVLMPFGGKYQLTPAMIMASKPPVGNGFTHTVTCSSFAIYTDLMEHSPYLGTIYSIVGAVSKLVASGVEYKTIRLTLQEFFKRLGKDSERWGEPLSALLGALDAQMNLKIGAIGGKDSMSGTFENIDVPPTVIAFAMGVTKDTNIIHNAFDNEGKIYKYSIKKDEFGRPDFTALIKMYAEIEDKIKSKEIVNATVVEQGGSVISIIKSLLGNRMGATLEVAKEDFLPTYADIIVVAKGDIESEFATFKGEINESGKLVLNGKKVSFDGLEKAFTGTLDSVFPTTASAKTKIITSNFETNKIFKRSESIAKPRVFIPVFPGTNCEYDTAKAFEKAGAVAEIFVIKNQKANEIEESVKAMQKLIANSQIIAFPGGFSGGDEPDGSGKFIATTFKNPILKEEVENLLYNRDGLALGICNGFQALVKLGLLPYGRIEDQTADSPTLTFNNISRHVSTIVNVRVGSNNSPWLKGVKVGEVYSVPVSHGEGKFICNKEHFEKLYNNGQIFSQYCGLNGKVTATSPFNPNGSHYAIEGIVSADGRIIGKMGHSERFHEGLYQNVPGNYDMKIFRSGVEYFK